jgi:hypothetical protein
MAETRVIITAEANQAIQEFTRLRAEATGALGQIGRAGAHLDQIGMSAGQVAQALRQVPAQFTDIVVSLQAGQSPLTVFLQQGGQLRDMFGSSGAAARALGGYVLGLINPFTLLAAGVGVVALAYYQGSKEADAYTRAIVMNGNAAGVSKGQLADMAREIGKGDSTQGDAAAALAALAGTGKVAVANMRAFALTAVNAEKSIGTAVSDTVKDFDELGKSPLQVTLRLNEKYNYLTAAVYEQIRALEKRGDVDAAGEVAQKAYSSAMDSRAAALKANLGSLESAWEWVGLKAKKAWDWMLNIGREDTLTQKIEDIKGKIKSVQLEQMTFVGSSRENKAESNVRMDNLKKELAGLQATKAAEEQANAAKKTANDLEQAKIKWSQDGEKYLTRQVQLQEAITKARFEGAAAGKSEQEINARIAQIQQSYSDIANDAIGAQIEAIKRRGAVEDVVTRRSMDLLVSKNSVGLVSEEDYINAVAQLDDVAFVKQKARLVEELALTAKKQNSQKEQASLLGRIAELTEQQASRALKTENELFELEVRRTRTAAGSYAELIEKQQGVTQSLVGQITAQRDANAQIGLTKEGIAQLAVARLEERAALADQNAEIAEGVDFSGRLSEQYRNQASDLRALAKARQEGAAAQAISDKFSPKDLEDFLDPAKAKSFGEALKDAFGGAGDALSKLQSSLKDYGIAQTTIERARGAAAIAYKNDSTKLAAANLAIAKKETQVRLAAYGDMAGAAAGFFGEQSRGYQALSAVSRVFHAAELAMTLAELVPKGISAVLNQAQGDPYSAFARMAAMAAIVTGLGVAIGGVGGSGGGKTAAEVQKGQGTGSVFGDIGVVQKNGEVTYSDKSDSIRRAIEQLKDNSDNMLPINLGMLSALQAIESAMTGLTNLVVRTTGLTAGTNMGITEGQLNAKGSATDFVSNFMTQMQYVFAGPILGGKLASIGNNLWGKVTQEIVDSGIQYAGGIRDLQAGTGFDQYATVNTTKSSWFGLSKKTSSSVKTQGLSDELADQLGLIFTNLDKSLQAASVALGGSAADVTKVLDTLTLAETKISLKGLTGTALTDALNSVISKSMDEIAQAAFPQFESFRQVGEGYAETVMRLAGDYAKLDAVLSASSTTFGATGIASVAARENLIKLAGGIDQLASQSNSFAENFLSKAEQLAPMQKYVTDQLAAMGLQSLTTRDQFKEYLLDLANSGALLNTTGDITTRSQAQYAALLALNEAYAKTHAATEDLTKSEQEIADERKDLQKQYNELMMTSVQLLAKERDGIAAVNLVLYDQIKAVQAFNAVGEAQSNLETAYYNQRSALQEIVDLRLKEADATQKQIDALKLSDLSTLSPEQKYFEAQRQFDTATSGEAKNAAAQTLLTASRSYNGATESYARDYAKVQAILALQMVSQKSSAEIAQQQLDALDKQVSSLIDINKGVSKLDSTMVETQKAILGVGSAMLTLAGANTAAGKPNVGNGATQGQSAVDGVLTGLYKDLLGRTPDAEGLKFWAAVVASGQSYDQIVAGIKGSAEYIKLNGAHANGGIASGWSLVGEQGPEVVNFSQPARVYTASQSREMFGGGNGGDGPAARESAQLLREVLVELRADKTQRGAVAKETIAKLSNLEQRFAKQSRVLERAE